MPDHLTQMLGYIRLYKRIIVEVPRKRELKIEANMHIFGVIKQRDGFRASICNVNSI